MTQLPLLAISGLTISAGEKEIVKGVDLTVLPGEVHAIMGPNGSGKSTLVSTLMGHPAYRVTGGRVTFRGEDLLALSPEERAKRGLFLAFQYPKEIAGVTFRDFLFAAVNEQMEARDPRAKIRSPVKFKAFLEERARALHFDVAFLERAINRKFSGGEKKRAEVLQLDVLKPLLSLLDETDSGLDVDALRTVAEGLNRLRTAPPIDRPPFTAVLVTHYARILSLLKPDHVHVMVGGRIVESGGPMLAEKLEETGYKEYGGRDESPPSESES